MKQRKSSCVCVCVCVCLLHPSHPSRAAHVVRNVLVDARLFVTHRGIARGGRNAGDDVGPALARIVHAFVVRGGHGRALAGGAILRLCGSEFIRLLATEANVLLVDVRSNVLHECVCVARQHHSLLEADGDVVACVEQRVYGALRTVVGEMTTVAHFGRAIVVEIVGRSKARGGCGHGNRIGEKSTD